MTATTNTEKSNLLGRNDDFIPINIIVRSLISDIVDFRHLKLDNIRSFRETLTDFMALSGVTDLYIFPQNM